MFTVRPNPKVARAYEIFIVPLYKNATVVGNVFFGHSGRRVATTL